MIASGRMPRSPVWLRKIPSTVSGSQGSRRGLRPAVRFAFPLGAKMYITDFPAPGQGEFRIRAELFRRAGGFRRIVGVSPGRAIVTDGPLPPILVEGSPQPGEAGRRGREARAARMGDGRASRPDGKADSGGFPHKKMGAGPRRRPKSDTLFALWAPMGPASPARPRARRAGAPGNKKEGPAVSGGPLGNPWWSLGGSNP